MKHYLMRDFPPLLQRWNKNKGRKLIIQVKEITKCNRTQFDCSRDNYCRKCKGKKVNGNMVNFNDKIVVPFCGYGWKIPTKLDILQNL